MGREESRRSITGREIRTVGSRVFTPEMPGERRDVQKNLNVPWMPGEVEFNRISKDCQGGESFREGAIFAATSADVQPVDRIREL